MTIVYLGYLIGGGELNIGLMITEAINQCPTPTNVIGVRSFNREALYLRKLITLFSTIVTPLHIVTTNEYKFH